MTRGRMVIVAVVSIGFLLSFSEFANALNPCQFGCSSSDLKKICDDRGGTYMAPSAAGVFACLLPDGTLISCGGYVYSYCTQTRTLPGTDFSQIDSLLLTTDTSILTKVNDISTQLQSSSCQLPDLVPLTAPASVPPDGFCQRNDQGQLLVNVYNQGAAQAVASTTRIAFICADPGQCASRSPIVVDAATPALNAASGTDLAPIDIPAGCFDPNTLNCSFRIGVDATGTVIESNETNNNVSGLCGPQFQ